MPSALHDVHVHQSVENAVGCDNKRRGAQSPFHSTLNSIKQPCDIRMEETPPSVVKTLRDENSRLASEVLALQEELQQLRRNPNSSPTKETTVVPSSLSVRERPPRSSSLQLRRRSIDNVDDDTSYEVSVHDRGVSLLVDARSWHPPAHHQATATNLPHDVESHQSSQGLHHRRVAAAGVGAGGAAHARPNQAASLTTATRARPLAVTGGGAPDEGDDEDDHAFVRSAAETQASASFCARVQDRAGWLVGLLVLQSMSSFIISRNEALLQSHLVIVQFLTMLVGAGGNAGNQASVRAIRGLATGTVNDRNVKTFLAEELKMGVTLSAILGVAGFVRAVVFAVPMAETIAITTSLCTIVFISVVLGALLPLAMLRVGIDPAHSSTTIQVLMDILGVTITVVVSGTILDSPFHQYLKGGINEK